MERQKTGVNNLGEKKWMLVLLQIMINEGELEPANMTDSIDGLMSIALIATTPALTN